MAGCSLSSTDGTVMLVEPSASGLVFAALIIRGRPRPVFCRLGNRDSFPLGLEQLSRDLKAFGFWPPARLHIVGARPATKNSEISRKALEKWRGKDVEIIFHPIAPWPREVADVFRDFLPEPRKEEPEASRSADSIKRRPIGVDEEVVDDPPPVSETARSVPFEPDDSFPMAEMEAKMACDLLLSEIEELSHEARFLVTLLSGNDNCSRGLLAKTWKSFLAQIETAFASGNPLPDLAEVITCLAAAHPLPEIWRKWLESALKSSTEMVSFTVPE